MVKYVRKDSFRLPNAGLVYKQALKNWTLVNICIAASASTCRQTCTKGLKADCICVTLVPEALTRSERDSKRKNPKRREGPLASAVENLTSMSVFGSEPCL